MDKTQKELKALKEDFEALKADHIETKEAVIAYRRYIGIIASRQCEQFGSSWRIPTPELKIK